MRTYSAIVTLALAGLATGCGTTGGRSGTEQLLASDAVDRSISAIDFSLLAGRTVFFDDGYVKSVKGVGFVNSDYIVSSLRQQMSAAGCLLQDTIDKADYVVEARVGTLGTDQHDVTYGLPASNGLSAAASVISSTPTLPAIPEISVAKRADQEAVAKIGVFAYHRETHQPIWQSGTSVARSNARDTWILGAGPIQRGTIYDGTRFAGAKLWGSRSRSRNQSPAVLAYTGPRQFVDPNDLERRLAGADEPQDEAEGVQQVGHDVSEPASDAQ